MTGLHGILVRWVPRGDVEADFGRVKRGLAAMAMDPSEQMDAVVAYRRWAALPVAEQRGTTGFLEAVKAARVERMAATGVPGGPAFVAETDAEVRREAFKTRRYWVNLVFEGVFFRG
jgi:hypothetical protein